MTSKEKLLSLIKELLNYVYKYNQKKINDVQNKLDEFEFSYKLVRSLDRRISSQPFEQYNPKPLNLRKFQKIKLDAKGYACCTLSYNGYLREYAFQKMSEFNTSYLYFFYIKGLSDNVREIALYCHDKLVSSVNTAPFSSLSELSKYRITLDRYYNNKDLIVDFINSLDRRFSEATPEELFDYYQSTSSEKNRRNILKYLLQITDEEKWKYIRMINVGTSNTYFILSEFLRKTLSESEILSFISSKRGYYYDKMKLEIYFHNSDKYQKEIRDIAYSNLILVELCNEHLNEIIHPAEFLRLFEETHRKYFLYGVSILSRDHQELEFCLINGSQKTRLQAFRTMLRHLQLSKTDWDQFLEFASTKMVKDIISTLKEKKVYVPFSVVERVYNLNHSIGLAISRYLPKFDQLYFIISNITSRQDFSLFNQLEFWYHRSNYDFTKCDEPTRIKIINIIEEKSKYYNFALIKNSV